MIFLALDHHEGVHAPRVPAPRVSPSYGTTPDIRAQLEVNNCARK